MSLMACFIVALAAGSLWVASWVWGLSKALAEGNAKGKRYREQRKNEIAAMNDQDVKQTILDHPYFTPSLRQTPTLYSFLEGIRSNDPSVLQHRWNESKIYGLLVKAERENNQTGRPIAVDYAWEITDLVAEYVKRVNPKR